MGLKSKKRRREGGGESVWWQRWFLPVGGARRPRAWARLPRGQTRYCHWVEESGICCETPAKRTQVMMEKHWMGINLRTNNSQKVYGRVVALEVGPGLCNTFQRSLIGFGSTSALYWCLFPDSPLHCVHSSSGWSHSSSR